MTRYRDGVPFSKFENPSKARNEALDCRVYAFGALQLLNVDWKRVAKSFGTKTTEKAELPVTRKPVKKRRRSGWMDGY